MFETTLTDEEREFAYQDHLKTLCIYCSDAPRKRAPDEATMAFVPYPDCGQVCRPCAIFEWGSGLLKKRALITDMGLPQPRGLWMWGCALLLGHGLVTGFRKHVHRAQVLVFPQDQKQDLQPLLRKVAQ